MPWFKLCDADISLGRAVSYNIAGTDLIVMHCNDGYRILAPVCPHAPRFLLQEDSSECVDDAAAPKCNRHIGPDGKPASLGICEEPIFTYASRVVNKAVYVDLDKRRIAPYQRITCSPVVKNRQIVALQFCLWFDGERKESIYAAPAHAARS